MRTLCDYQKRPHSTRRGPVPRWARDGNVAKWSKFVANWPPRSRSPEDEVKDAKEKLAIVEEELEEVLFGVSDDTDEEMEDNIFVNPNDSPSRSPKKKKKKKGKWGGDRCSAAYRASQNVGSPARPTGHKQVI